MREPCAICGEVVQTTGEPCPNKFWLLSNVDVDLYDGYELSFHFLFINKRRFIHIAICENCLETIRQSVS